jgi:cytochrome c
MKKVLLSCALLATMCVTSVLAQNNVPQSAASCISCHGQKGEKSALGKSKILNQMTPDEIKISLILLQSKTYEALFDSFGGETRKIMRKNAQVLTENQIVEVANYFGKK